MDNDYVTMSEITKFVRFNWLLDTAPREDRLCLLNAYECTSPWVPTPALASNVGEVMEVFLSLQICCNFRN